MNLLKIDENEPILVDSAVDDQVSYLATLYVFLKAASSSILLLLIYPKFRF
jgi:hypothetical protein